MWACRIASHAYAYTHITLFISQAFRSRFCENVLHFYPATYRNICIVSRWPSLAPWAGFTLPSWYTNWPLCVDVPLNSKHPINQAYMFYVCDCVSMCMMSTWLVLIGGFCRYAYCCPEPIHRKIIWHCSSYFVVAICYEQNCELSYNVLGMTENCNHTEWIYYRTGCGIWLVGGKCANVILWTIDRELLHAGLRFLRPLTNFITWTNLTFFQVLFRKFKNKLHDLMILYLDYSTENWTFSLIYV